MRMQSPFPPAGSGEVFLTEGGTETEMLYRHGFELPEFCMLPLLDDRRAMEVLRSLFCAQLDVAAEFGLSMMLTGLDYRASPDWGTKLGYSPAALAEANIHAIAFLRDIAAEYEGQVPRILIGGIIGPRGDAYGLNRGITPEGAEAYHAVQLATLRAAGADFACAATFNSAPEAVGVARAAGQIGLPLSISLTLDGTSRLKSGPALGAAITEIDAQAGADAPDFYMLNCSHPLEYEPALEPGDWTLRLRGVRPNASPMDKIALCKLGHLEEGDPVELGSQIGDLARRYPHMDIFGGCCGTGAAHLREIAVALKARSRVMDRQSGAGIMQRDSRRAT